MVLRFVVLCCCGELGNAENATITLKQGWEKLLTDAAQVFGFAGTRPTALRSRGLSHHARSQGSETAYICIPFWGAGV